MHFNKKIEIDILDFFKTGKFDCLVLGQSMEYILNNFPDPTGFVDLALLSNYTIWNYGKIELHFNNKMLFMIYCDYIYDLDAGEHLEINPWILSSKTELLLSTVLGKLNDLKIDYQKVTDKVCKSVHLILSSGVKLNFVHYSESHYRTENLVFSDSQNDYIMIAFCLTDS